MQKIKHQTLIMFTIGIIMLMELLDANVLNTSLPQIAYSLKVNPIDLKIAISVYLLTLGAFIPVATWISDRLGIKRVLIIAIIGFLIASLFCGLSINLPMLTICRAIQGMFGAFIMPLARLALVRIFKDNIALALSKTAPIVLLGTLLGPVIGGMLTTWLNWRFIFFINIPVGILAILIMISFFPSLAGYLKKRFDWLGFILIGAGLVTALSVFDVIVEPHINNAIKISFIILSVVLLASYYYYARKCKYAIIDLNVFFNRDFRWLIVLSSLIRLFSLGMLFIGPLYMQTRLNYTALDASFLVLPAAVGSWLAKFSIHYFLKRYQQALIWKLCLNGFGQLIIAYLMLHFNVLLFIITLLVMGWCTGSIISLVNTNIYNTLDEKKVNAGVTINSMVIQLSGSFSIAIIALILIASSGQHLLAWNTVLPKMSFAIVMIINAFFTFLTSSLVFLMKKD